MKTDESRGHLTLNTSQTIVISPWDDLPDKTRGTMHQGPKNDYRQKKRAASARGKDKKQDKDREKERERERKHTQR
jgi:hypothetical protein